jgi:hypothetical protein
MLPLRSEVRIRLFGGFSIAAIAAVCISIARCAPPPNNAVGETGPIKAADTCDDRGEPQSLAAFAKQCAAVITEDVPGFDCDAGTLVPDDHPTGPYPIGDCDRPNVLNHVCDPDSRFQVLKQTPDVAIVAHCRKKGSADHRYGDIAVIQYNQKNGATCFYQALGTLDAKVTAPSEGNGPGKFPWFSPAQTADIHCVQCHDNGPFVRSPYLAQLRDEPKNRLPGTNAGSGPWDHRFSWNQTIPYMFVGNAFQSWKAYSVTVQGTGSGCTGCHRLGISAFGGSYTVNAGTAQVFGPEATAPAQTHKNPHSAASPIWMTPGQTTYSAANETEAKGMAACAAQIVKRGNDPNAPNPPAGCQATQFAQGNSCRTGPISAVINGATQSAPSSSRSDVVVDLGACTSGSACPPGFCYWRSVHGPFWQKTPTSVPIGDASYRGSFIRIYGEGGVWKSRAFSDPTGGPANAPPGGTVECTRFNEIAAVPDPNKCFANLSSVIDKDGSQVSGAVDATVAGATTANIDAGFIGNVAQANTGPQRDGPDFMRVSEIRGKVLLSFLHTPAPPSPLKPGPLTGEAWVTGCTGWTANYVAKDVYTTPGRALVPAPRYSRMLRSTYRRHMRRACTCRPRAVAIKWARTPPAFG